MRTSLQKIYFIRNSKIGCARHRTEPQKDSAVWTSFSPLSSSPGARTVTVSRDWCDLYRRKDDSIAQFDTWCTGHRIVHTYLFGFNCRFRRQRYTLSSFTGRGQNAARAIRFILWTLTLKIEHKCRSTVKDKPSRKLRVFSFFHFIPLTKLIDVAHFALRKRMGSMAIACSK